MALGLAAVLLNVSVSVWPVPFESKIWMAVGVVEPATAGTPSWPVAAAVETAFCSLRPLRLKLTGWLLDAPLLLKSSVSGDLPPDGDVTWPVAGSKVIANGEPEATEPSVFGSDAVTFHVSAADPLTNVTPSVWALPSES